MQSLEHTFKGGQGLGSYAQTVVCLHLAANQAGTAVDSKSMAKVPVFEYNYQRKTQTESPST